MHQILQLVGERYETTKTIAYETEDIIINNNQCGAQVTAETTR